MNYRKRARALIAFVMALPMLASNLYAQENAAPAAGRAITHLRGDLFRVRDGHKSTVFLVTSEGIVVADPLSAETALWLKEEFERRYPQQPVRFVLHTHHHFDRAEGAGVFNQTAEIVGHRNFNRELSAARKSMPSFADWERSAADKDRNGDGEVTPEELYRRVRDVETIYDSRRTITLGGKRVELIHVDSTETPDMTVLFFPTERVVFAADHAALAAAPFTFGSSPPREVLAVVQAIAPLDFDLLVSGTGDTMAQSEVITLQNYLNALVERVMDGYAAGRSVTELQAQPLLEAYRGTTHYAARTTQIADLYRTLTLARAEISGAALAQYSVRDRAYCASFSTCTAGGVLTAGAAGLSYSLGRFGAAVEVTSGQQSWSSRTSALYDDEIARRESRTSLLLRYGPAPGTLSIAILGGISATMIDARGMSRVKGGFAPFAGRHPIAARTVEFGVTGGVDVVKAIGSRFSLILPVRVTHNFPATDRSVAERLPARLDVHAGVGLSMRLLRKIR